MIDPHVFVLEIIFAYSHWKMHYYIHLCYANIGK